ncbi:MAG: CRISPR system precrRNA processing endoribonuclease RAMP protein Cas6 [Phormidesmis sp.]
MPQSLVLNLITQSVIPQKYLQGHAPQQLFFDLLDEVDPELSHVLRQDERNRSYSLSALQVETCAPAHKATPLSAHPLSAHPLSTHPLSHSSQGKLRLFSPKHDAPLQFLHHQPILPGTRCWWRITFLDDELFDHLIFLWNQLVGEPFQLGTGTVTITHVAAHVSSRSTAAKAATWLETDWAFSCSYRDLYEQASAYEQDIHIQFVTPTAFEERGCVTPMPTADAVFQPLRKRWNRYSDLVFAPSLVHNIVPTKFDIKTEDIQSERAMGVRPRRLSGCTGQVSFRILDNDPLTTKRINALADFSRYCGIGYGTPVGMGVVRRVSGASAIAYQSQIQS